MTARPILVERDWFKSSRSSENAACVEVRLTTDTIGVRDSKDRNGPTLAFSAAAWTHFLIALPQPRG